METGAPVHRLFFTAMRTGSYAIDNQGEIIGSYVVVTTISVDIRRGDGREKIASVKHTDWR